MNLTLPENVTYHKVGGETQTEGTVKIYGGTTFYFSAPKTVTGTWKSETLNGQIGTQWKTLVVSTGSGSQDIGYGDPLCHSKKMLIGKHHLQITSVRLNSSSSV